MAPSYDNLPVDDDFDENEIDFSDLKEQYEVRLEEGLDAFVVIDGLPKVPDASKTKLQRFLLKKLGDAGKAREDSIFMPLNEETGNTEGFAFVEFGSPAEAAAVARKHNGTQLDRHHAIAVNKLVDIDRFGREGRIDEEYTPPHIEPFQESEHLRWWLSDPDSRDQIAMYKGDRLGMYWNEKEQPPEKVIERDNWTEQFFQWSPQGTYLMSVHERGVRMWGGKSWRGLKRFPHSKVNLIDFSPCENYLVTWSHLPIEVDENHPNPPMTADEDGKNYVIWDIATEKPVRSFVTLDLPTPQQDEHGNPIKKKMQWPTFKWSADDKYVARMTPGQSISIYELPSMGLLGKSSVKIEGVVDFEWAPSTSKRDGVKTYEQLLCFWTPELGSNPAKVALMSIPSKEIVRTRNLFNVSDAKLHWQSEASFLCVKVDRHSKTKKSIATNLEIFRIREKGVPVEVVDSLKDTVINFAWEPKGNRFVLITTSEGQGAGVAPKTAVSFFAPERTKSGVVGGFHHVRTTDKKTSNAIYWSPKGRFVVIATLANQQSFELEFWDLSFEKSKEDKANEGDKELMANLQLMNTAEHYGVTEVEWDPTGRYVATVASVWKHRMENGYHLYDFRGNLLREEHIDGFKQFLWRPRPPTLLPKEEQSDIRKNLRNYSKIFEEQDTAKKSSANKAVVEHRRRLLSEWLAWRESVEQELREEKEILGIEDEETVAQMAEDGVEEVEEIVEEIIDEKEEVVS